MTDAALRLVDEGDERIEPVAPTVFTRSISAPAGTPWDQARAATLEARLGAPLPLSEVVYRLWRLERWSFGRPARYAVCYVRAREVGDKFDTTVIVDGRSIRVRLFSNAERRRQARISTIILAVAATTSLLVVGAIAAAFSTRTEASTNLAMVEQTAATELRQAQTLERMKDQTRWLNAAHVQGQSLNNFLNDLAWATAAKAPDAHIDSIHWEHGLLGVEVRGDTPPFGQTDRSVIKVPKPLRPGVWLWGVGPQGQPPPPPSPAPEAGP